MALQIPQFSYDDQKHTITINGTTQSIKAGYWKWKKVYAVVDPSDQKVSFVSLNFFQRILRLFGAYEETKIKNVQKALKQVGESFETKEEQNLSIREQLFRYFARSSPSVPSSPPVSLSYETIATKGDQKLRPYAMIRLAEMSEKQNDHPQAFEWYKGAAELMKQLGRRDIVMRKGGGLVPHRLCLQ